LLKDFKVTKGKLLLKVENTKKKSEKKIRVQQSYVTCMQSGI